MTSRRGATSLSGILLVDKPSRCTSHDVVSRVRRATGERRIGHAGTLDPDATGLLVVLVGPATRLAPYLSAADKSYEATIVFGQATDTEDADGAIVETKPVPECVFQREYAVSVLDSFEGTSMQEPPAYSAIKIGGRPAYHAARTGEPPTLVPRQVFVRDATLVALDATTSSWHVMFDVSKGTYIRSLARDIGLRAGTVAHLGSLRRTRSGSLEVSRAASIDSIEAAGRRGELESLFEDPLTALGHLHVLTAPWQDVRAGKPLADVEGTEADERLAVLTEGGDLAAIYVRSGDALVPEVVLATPARRVQ